MATAPPDRLLTAEDLKELSDDGLRYELVQGWCADERLSRMSVEAGREHVRRHGPLTQLRITDRAGISNSPDGGCGV